MTKVLIHTYTSVKEYRAHISSILLAACMLLTLIYAFNIYQVIAHTVSIQSTEKQMAAMGNTLKDLDAEYLKLSSGITPDILKTHGFRQGTVSEYISRSTSLGRVAVSGYEL